LRHDRCVLADRCNQLVIDKPAKRPNVFRLCAILLTSIHEMDLNGLNKYGIVFLWINIWVPVNECTLDRWVWLED